MLSTYKKYTRSLYRWFVSSAWTTAILILPIAVFFVYFFVFRYNIPWFDDFENIPYFLDSFLRAPSFSAKMLALLRPNNEHRVVYARLVTLGQFFLTGKLNFGHLMLWGNAALVVMFYLIYRALRRHEGQTRPTLVGMLPVPLLLFSAQMYLMTFTAVFTLQYLSIIMLAMLTFFALAANKRVGFGVAAGLGVLASFSMGNGLLVWPVGAAMLLLQRRWVALGLWLLIGGLSGYFYFLGYPVQQGNAEGFTYVMQHPFQTLAGFIILVGNAFDVFPTLPIQYRVYPPFLAGLILLAGLSYWMIHTLFRRPKNTSFLDTFLFGCLLFLLATFGLFALFRIRFNFEMVVHLSYRVYALTLCALACVLLFSRLPETSRARIWPAVWIFFVVLNVYSYFTYIPLAIERRQSMQGLTFNQLRSHIGLGGERNSALADYITNLLVLMNERGWYRLPDPAIEAGEQTVLAPVTGPVLRAGLTIQRQGDYILISNTDPTYEVAYGTGTYVVLKSNTHTYLMFAGEKYPVGTNPWRVQPGFRTAIPIKMVQPGHYRVGLFRTAPGRSNCQFTNQFVDVD